MTEGRPMTGRNRHGQALDRLGQEIVSSAYSCGATLPAEPLLCETLGVSRTVVREAVKSLVAKGLLVTGPKLGTRVLPEASWNWFDADVVRWKSRGGLTRPFLRDLQELRRIVEPAAVRLAAQRANKADLAELEAAFASMQWAIERGGDYVSPDLRFHQGLLRACHNRMLEQMGKALGALLRTSFEISSSRPDSAINSLAMHRAVLNAVVARAPDAAERAILVLIDGAARDISAVLTSRRKLPSLTAPARSLPAPPSLAARRGAAPRSRRTVSKAGKA